MDPKQSVRAFIEQRLEAGETEVVFENLTAEQALALVRDARPAAGGVGDWRDTLRAAGVSGPAAKPPSRIEPLVSEPLVSEPPAWVPPPAPGAAPGPPLASQPVRAGLLVGSGEGSLFGGPRAELQSLTEVAAAVATCTLCPLYATAKSPVPGEGSPTAELVCVGEAPGATEDQTGRPFVGQAGQLLTKMLAAIQLTREEVFICNVLKHRPPGNRNPLPLEVEACTPYLLRQLELIRPKVIVAFGTFAAQTLLQTRDTIGKLRGVIHRYYGIPLIVTYHPAALLRNPSWKRPAWEDVQLARRILDSNVAAGA